eukprot:c28787_g1_i6 orf=327-644(-)
MTCSMRSTKPPTHASSNEGSVTSISCMQKLKITSTCRGACILKSNLSERCEDRKLVLKISLERLKSVRHLTAANYFTLFPGNLLQRTAAPPTRTSLGHKIIFQST